MSGPAHLRWWERTAADTLGNVSPCPGVDLKVGNIRERSLHELLSTSEVFRNLREIRQRIEGECRDCHLSEKCYGCRGAAYQETGNYLASDTLCWHVQAKRAASLPESSSNA